MGRTKQWIADGGLDRKHKWEQWQEKLEKESNASCSTASTATQRRSLTDAEEKEARKYEKVLREIAKIEERVANGEKVDCLQLRKIDRNACDDKSPSWVFAFFCLGQFFVIPTRPSWIPSYFSISFFVLLSTHVMCQG